MPLTNEFDEELRNIVAKNIPCVHMPGLLLAEKALNVFKVYLQESKDRGLNTIDEILEDMKIKNGQ
jgi:hypothetical protein